MLALESSVCENLLNMLAPGVNTTMLAEVRFTGDGVYREGTKLFRETVEKCGSEACRLVSVTVRGSDCLQGKSEVIADCAHCERDCNLDNESLKVGAETLRLSSPDELEAGPDVGDRTDLVVDDSQR